MKTESRELEESERHWRLRYDCLIEEQNLLKTRETTYRNQLGTLHQILAAISPKRPFSLPVSPRRSGGGDSSAIDFSTARRSSRSPPAKVRLQRESMESAPSQTDTSNQSSQDFWVADIQGNVFFYFT